MKILHIMNNSLNELSGIATVVPDLVIAQNKYTYLISHLLILKNENRYDDLFNGIYFFETKIKKIQKQIEDEKYDLIIFHGVYHLNYLKISNYLRSVKIKYIIVPHCSFMKNAQENKKLKKFFANYFLFRKFFKGAECFSFLNNEEQKKSIYNKRFIIIPNGVSIEKNRILNKNIKNSNQIKILYIGRIDIYHKGLDILLTHLLELKNFLKENNITISIYGSGKISEEIKFKNKIKEFNLEKYVKIYGRIEKEKKQIVYEEHDFLILTSRYEGLPLVILEALKFGCPCFVSQNTNMLDEILYFKSGSGYENEKNNFNIKFCNFIKEYKINKKIYRENTQKHIKKYNWKNIAEISLLEYLKIIRR